ELRQIMLDEFDEEEDPTLRERILALDISPAAEEGIRPEPSHTAETEVLPPTTATTPQASVASERTRRQPLLEAEDVGEVFAEEQARGYYDGDEDADEDEEPYRLSDEIPYRDENEESS
ncbi:MAG: hypothetical protein NZ473_05015, partial [Candidatus Kapabacteria bacterium]|nr:hypothetical protein [Candidatus Kapabacteria bacterium]MDW8225752.1 hypothetical protein [Bacteroidota bacterium]